MKLDTINLKNALSRAYKAVESKPIIQSLTAFILTKKAGEGKLSVLSSNLNLYVSDSVPCASNDEEIKVAVSADLLMRFIDKIKSDSVEFNFLSDKVVLKAKEGKVTLPIISQDGFPVFPTGFHNETYLPSIDDFLSAVKSVPFYSSDTSRIYSAVNIISSEDKMEFQSADGYRMSMKTVDVENNNLNNLLISGASLKSVCSILSAGGGGDLYIEQNGSYAKFKSGTTEVTARLSAYTQSYPDLKKLIIKQPKYVVSCKAKDLINAINTAVIFEDSLNKHVHLLFQPAFLTVKAHNQSGEIECEPIDLQPISENQMQEDMMITFNSSYIMGLIRAVESQGEDLMFKITQNTTLVGVEPIDNDSYTCIVMPIKL